MAKPSSKSKAADKTAGKDTSDPAPRAEPGVAGAAAEGSAAQGTGNLADRAREQVSSARDRAGEAASRAGENIKKTWEQTSDYAEERRKRAEETIGSVTEQSMASIERSAKATMVATRDAMQSMEKTAEEFTERLREFTRRYESATVSGTLAEERQMRVGHAAYLLYALGAATIVSGLMGLLLCYMRLNDEAISGTVLRSHFRWLINTFWLVAATLIVAALVAWLIGNITGGVIGLLALVWFCYRLVKGWLSLYDGKAIAKPNALW